MKRSPARARVLSALRRWRGAALLGVGAVLMAACGKDSPSSLDPQGPAAKSIASVWWLMFGLATAVYVVVAGFIIIGALRGRGRQEGKPSRISDGAFIWVGGLIVPSVILGLLAVVTVNTTDGLRQPDPNPLRIEVTGFQFWWAAEYKEEDFTTANEIRVPAGRPVEIGLHSQDVIHSFWVPQLAGKVDLVPGQRNVIRFTAEKPGEYRGQCAEYCGLQHAKMAFLVIAEEPASYERWMIRQQRPRAGPSSEREAAGEQVFMRSCAGCHAIRGTEAQGTKGPDLSDFGSRRTLGAVAVTNNRANLAGWIANSQTIKPGNLMPPVQLAPDELLNLVEYLENQR
ncbi:MAG: cytochrome c oxidase subunit II [Actinomycetota bacterium]|nr:cytochrome c oxidase subunit II [Actinomycetota bacterium]MDQ3574881.1 cytochrome c oxidase subunit II [Actinomycetota bacterium]